MKTTISQTLFRTALPVLVALFQYPAVATVSASVTPAAISNTYVGTITLQIGGLGSSESVIVQKYCDLNGDGVIDAGDVLVQQFELTDGQASLIDGVTNANVPCDWNPTAGTITTPLSLVQGGSLTPIAGKYAYVISSPSNHFSPSLTNFFIVTNYPYLQSITGTVMNGSTPVPNAWVVLLNYVAGSTKGLAAGTVSDSAGNYTIKAPTGSYLLFGGKSNYVAYVGGPVVTLNPGATIITNVSLLPATNRISGTVVDATNPGSSLPGLFITLKSTDGFIALATTDANGDFSAPVNAGTWSVNAQSLDLAFEGYVGNNSGIKVAVTSGTVSTNLAYPKATVLFYGSVKDDLGNPLPGVRLYGDDRGLGVYTGDAEVDGNGNYFMGLVPSTWDVEVDMGASGPQFANYVFSQAPWGDNGTGTTVSAGMAVRQDFTALLATHQISGYLQDAAGNPLAGVQISATTSINGSTFHAQSTTDSGGNYSLNVANGDWTVNVNCCNCNNCRCLNTSIYQCPNSQNVNIANGSANNINFIASLAGSVAVPGSVKDNNNRAIVGVKVYANNGSGNNLTTTTDGNGNFSFNLGNGNWDLSVDCSQLNSLGYGCPSDQVVAVPNGGLSGVIFIVSPCGTLQVSTTSLPDGMANFAYYYNDAAGYQLQNSGCNPPFTWSLTPGSQALPAGLSLAGNGWISGMPTTTGTNYFSLRLTDSKANSADQLLSVLVWPTVQITNAAVPNGSASLAYSATLGATGGAGGYFGWSISSGSLPPGLSISDGPGWTGLISGMPTQIGMFSFTVSLIDNSGYSPQRAYSITIRNASPTITTTNLPSGTVGVPYSTQLKAVGGTPPLNWSTAPGSQPLPVALTLSTNGLISGVPTVNGIFSFIVRATDANALSSTAPLTLTVNPGLTLSWPVSVGEQFRIQVQGTAPGQNYMLQMSTNLASAKWISLYATNAPGTSFLFTDPSATNPTAFYRVMTAP